MNFDSLKSDIDGCFAQINLYEGKAQYWIDQIRSPPTTADDSDDDTFILGGGRRSKNIGRGNLFETRRQIFISSVRVIFLVDALQLFDAELAENYLIALAESVKSAAALLQFEIDVYIVTRDSALLSNHDILALEDRVNCYTQDIKFQEANESRIIGILNHQSTNTVGTYIFDGTPKTVHELRYQLYKTRLLIYMYTVALRDIVDILRVHSPDQAATYSDIMGWNAKVLITRLQHEEHVYNATKFSELVNARYVFRDKWLMYHYGREFKEFTGPIPSPGGIDPGIAFIRGHANLLD
ncbi:hypothetical protein BGX33_009857 [Mortierella sp. NVP41]|nr:hypothetical protein BGX33_009857 [Mortierella sp. NVP41]